jgi:uncharacterized protein YaaQ
MKLVLAVLQSADVEALLGALTELRISATQIEGDAAIGRNGLAAVIAGVHDEDVAEVVNLVHSLARARTRRAEPLRPIAERAEFWTPGPMDQPAGGASVYVLPVSRFERIGYA